MPEFKGWEKPRRGCREASMVSPVNQGESGDYPDPEYHTAKCRISLGLKLLYRAYSGIVIFFFT